ncbi:MAG: hypothetical protein IM584_10020, partial [Chitinophagaceae bacterium]|nr:hypothetical protein [Chitinophagaceae bacterium]
MTDYLETASGITNGLATLAKTLTLGKFIRWIITVLIIGAIALYIFDKYSSTFLYNKIDRKLSVIEKVQKLGQSDSTIRQQTNLKLIEVLREINQTEKVNIISDSVLTAIIKLLGAILFPVFVIVANLKAADSRNIILGASIFLVVFGLIALFLPIIYSLWVNFFIFPIVEILIL